MKCVDHAANQPELGVAVEDRIVGCQEHGSSGDAEWTTTKEGYSKTA